MDKQKLEEARNLVFWFRSEAKAVAENLKTYHVNETKLTEFSGRIDDLVKQLESLSIAKADVDAFAVSYHSWADSVEEQIQKLSEDWEKAKVAVEKFLQDWGEE